MPSSSNTFLPKVAQLLRCTASPKQPQSGTALLMASHSVSGVITSMSTSASQGALRR